MYEKSKKNLKIKTDIYPGFPTDLQAQLIAAMCISDCETQIEETILKIDLCTYKN